MFQTKCGCPDCSRQSIPNARMSWKNRKNKHGHSYGVHQKGGRTHKRTNLKALLGK